MCLLQLKCLQWEHEQSQLASGATVPLYVSRGLGEQDVPNIFADYLTGGLFTFSQPSLVSNVYWKNKHAHVRECNVDTTFISSLFQNFSGEGGRMSTATNYLQIICSALPVPKSFQFENLD